MKLSLPMLALSSAFGALIGFGAASAQASVPAEPMHDSAITLQDLAQLLQLADNDSDDDSGQVGGDDDGAAMPCKAASGEDGESGEGGDDEGGDDEGGAGCIGAGSPAPAGTVAPPANGLFNGTAAPKAQING